MPGVRNLLVGYKHELEYVEIKPAVPNHHARKAYKQHTAVKLGKIPGQS
jgi:hypothetical protein